MPMRLSDSSTNRSTAFPNMLSFQNISKNCLSTSSGNLPQYQGNIKCSNMHHSDIHTSKYSFSDLGHVHNIDNNFSNFFYPEITPQSQCTDKLPKHDHTMKDIEKQDFNISLNNVLNPDNNIKEKHIHGTSNSTENYYHSGNAKSDFQQENNNESANFCMNELYNLEKILGIKNSDRCFHSDSSYNDCFYMESISPQLSSIGLLTPSVTTCVHNSSEANFLIGNSKRIGRRLNDIEKRSIEQGNIFIYSESESKIKRWTDKKIWGPSRIQGCFLVYKCLEDNIVKKTYCTTLNGEIYHLIAYSRLDWDMTGECCSKFDRNVYSLSRPSLEFHENTNGINDVNRKYLKYERH